MTATSHLAALPIPAGAWAVDPKRSEVHFAIKAMWGMSTVRGEFGTCRGGLTVAGASASGEMEVDAAGLRTGNARRDRHLRSADFFDTERHPWIRFRLAAMTAVDGDLTVAGELRIGDAELRLELPVEVIHAPDGALGLHGTTVISRAAAGLSWNWLGTIADDVSVEVRTTLTRAGV